MRRLSCRCVCWCVWQCSAISLYTVFHGGKRVSWRPVKCYTRPDQYKKRRHLPGHKGDVKQEVNRAETSGFNSHRWSPCHGRERERSRGKNERGNPDLISYHCISHQSVLYFNLSDKYAELMMRTINFLRASFSYQHCMLRELLREADAKANDLLVHNSVRWLSKGRLLEHFWSIQREITAFLTKVKRQKTTPFSLFLEDERKMDNVAFLADITSCLKELNLKLQGKNNSVCDLMTAVFRTDLKGDWAHFPTVQEQVQRQERCVFLCWVCQQADWKLQHMLWQL